MIYIIKLLEKIMQLVSYIKHKLIYRSLNTKINISFTFVLYIRYSVFTVLNSCSVKTKSRIDTRLTVFVHSRFVYRRLISDARIKKV